MNTANGWKWGCVALGLLLVSALPASAETWKWGEGSQEDAETQFEPGSNVIVITNVDVNVKTWLDLLAEPKVDQKKASGSATNRPAKARKKGSRASQPSLADLVAAIGKLSKDRSNIVVITNVKIDVSSWLDLLDGAKKADVKRRKP